MAANIRYKLFRDNNLKSKQEILRILCIESRNTLPETGKWRDLMRAESTGQLELRRERAIGLLRNGVSPAEVARILKVHRSSVSRWSKNFNKKGHVNSISKRGKCGSLPRLCSDALDTLRKVLTDGPRKLGYPDRPWTTRLAARFIAENLVVEYHPDHVGRILHALGWEYIKQDKDRTTEKSVKARGASHKAGWYPVKVPMKGHRS